MNKPFAEYKNFTGENTVSDPFALKPTELLQAINIDFDINRMAHVKKHGSFLKTAGVFNNLWSNGKIILFTRDGNLYLLGPDLTTITLLREDVTDQPMSYVDPVGTGIVYYSNLRVIGYIQNLTNYLLPPTTVPNRIDTPPMYPIEYFANRLWGFVGNVLIRTDPDPLFVFNSVNMGAGPTPPSTLFPQGGGGDMPGFYQRKGIGTLLKAVQDGLFFADGNHWFLKNAGRENEALDYLCEYDAIPGTATQNPVDIEVIMEDGSRATGKGHIWTSQRGIRFGLNGGVSGNFSRKRINIPRSSSGASLYRGDNDRYNQYITVVHT